MTASRTSLLLLAIVCLHAPTNLPAAELTLRDWVVAAKDDVQLSAAVAGVLRSLNVEEGSQVASDAVVAQIDDREARVEKQRGLARLKAAEVLATNDINVRYAKAAADVAELEYRKVATVYENNPEAFSELDVEQRKLAAYRARLQIEQAELEHETAGITVDERKAELAAAELSIERRQVRSPVPGEVVAVFKQPGEWAQPGDPILRIVRFDTLRVEGFVDSAKHEPAELRGRPVTVDVHVTDEKQVRVEGTIQYVSPLVLSGGEFLVRAEIKNRKTNGHWIVRSGLPATVTVQLAETKFQAARSAPR